jgi:hypothetical protein
MGKLRKDRLQASSGDIVEHGPLNAAPIGAMEQQHQWTACAGRQIADPDAVDVDRRPPRHRTSLLT